MNMTSWRAELKGCDLIEVTGEGKDRHVKMIGCEETIKMMETFRQKHGDDPAKWPLPSESSHSALLLKELILKIQGNWKPPYKDEEICHCRMVPTVVVEQAILMGAHHPSMVSRWTSASTACGTCRPDVESMIDYRLGKK